MPTKRPGKPSTAAPPPLEIRTALLMRRYLAREGLTEGAAEALEPALRDYDDDRRLPRRASFVLIAPTVHALAHETILFRRVRFEAVEPGAWEGVAGATSTEEGSVSVWKHRAGRKLQLSLPGATHLSAEVWRTTALTPTIRVVPPRVDPDRVAFRLPEDRVPPAAQWLELGRTVGLELVWADPDGRVVAPFRVPADLGSSYALFERTPTNMRFPRQTRVYAYEDGRFALSRGYEEPPDIGGMLGEALCRLEGLTVSTGNCRFTGPEWLEYLRTRAMPPREASDEAPLAPVLPLESRRRRG